MKGGSEVFAASVMGGLVGAVFYLPKYDTSLWDWRDGAAFIVLGLLLAWCFSPSSRDRSIYAYYHERPRDSRAFLLGKLLRRVFRSHRRRA